MSDGGTVWCIAAVDLTEVGDAGKGRSTVLSSGIITGCLMSEERRGKLTLHA